MSRRCLRTKNFPTNCSRPMTTTKMTATYPMMLTESFPTKSTKNCSTMFPMMTSLTMKMTNCSYSALFRTSLMMTRSFSRSLYCCPISTAKNRPMIYRSDFQSLFPRRHIRTQSAQAPLSYPDQPPTHRRLTNRVRTDPEAHSFQCSYC